MGKGRKWGIIYKGHDSGADSYIRDKPEKSYGSVKPVNMFRSCRQTGMMDVEGMAGMEETNPRSWKGTEAR